MDCSENNTGMRRYIPHILVGLGFSLILMGWASFAHGSESRSKTDAARSVNAQRDAQTLAYYGNGQLKILDFYANPSESARAGGRALVCYGVANAESVTIEPSLGETWPSTGRCLEAAPSKDTQYKLTARDAGGHQQVQTVMLHVKH